MAKIILTVNDTVLQEVPLSKERVAIGRRPHNDIVIDDLAISAEHAVIVTKGKDSFLEDLNSTNGTQINGQPVRKHFLQHDDVIELAQYKLRYVGGGTHKEGCGDLMHRPSQGGSAVTPPSQKCRQGNEVQDTFANSKKRKDVAAIRILNGASAGKQIPLTKALTTIGRPGGQVAVIAYRPQGYSITHVEGGSYPLVNGQSVGPGSQPMEDGDVIDLSGTRMQFSKA